MTPEQKIVYVEAQIKACMRSASNLINCPYCHAQNVETNPGLCCAEMGLTVRAILRRQAQHECIERAERIAERVARN